MSAASYVPSFLDVMKSPEFTGPEVLDQRAFHIRTVIKSGKHGKVALCEQGTSREVAIKSELIKSPNNPFSRPYREYFILKQLSALLHKPEYYENPEWIGFIQLLDWFKAKTDQVRITSTPASPAKTPTRLTGQRNLGSPTTPTSGSNSAQKAPLGSKTAPRSITAVSRLTYDDNSENVDVVGGSLSNLQLTPAGKRSRVSATPTPKRIVPRTPIALAQPSPLRQREIKLQEGNLVLEKADTTLYAIRSDLSFEIFRDVLFQILYALHVSQAEFEFVHHDLHIQNVLLKRLRVPLQDYLIEKTDPSGLIKYETVDEERLVDEHCGIFKDGETTWYSRGPWIVKLSDFGLSRIKMVDDDGRVVYDLTHPLAEAFLGDKDVLKILDEFSRAKITRYLTRAECLSCGAVVSSIKSECFFGPEASISLEDAQSVLQTAESIAAMEALVEQKQKSVRQVRAAIRKSALHLNTLLHHDFFAPLQTKPASMRLFGREESSISVASSGQEPEDDLDGLARSPTSVALSAASLHPSRAGTTPLKRQADPSSVKADDDAHSDHAIVTSLAGAFTAASVVPGDSATEDGDDDPASSSSDFDLEFDGFGDLAPLALPVKRLTFEDAIVESPVKVDIARDSSALEIVDICSVSPTATPSSSASSRLVDESSVDLDGNGMGEDAAELAPMRRSARVAARGPSSSRPITTPTKPPTASQKVTPRRALVKPDPVVIAKAVQSPVVEDSTKYANKAKTPTPAKKPASSSKPARRNTILPSEFASLIPDHGVHSMNDSLASLCIEPVSAPIEASESHITTIAQNASFTSNFAALVSSPAVIETVVVVYDPVPVRWLGEPHILPMLNDTPTDGIEAVRDYLMRRAQHWEENRHKRRPFNIKRYIVRNEQEIHEARVHKLAMLRKKKPVRRSLGGARSGGKTELEKAVKDSQRSRRKSMSASSSSTEQNGTLASELSLDVSERLLEVVSEALESKFEDSLDASNEVSIPMSLGGLVLNPLEQPRPRVVGHLEANGLGLLTSPTAPRRSVRRRSSLIATPLSTPVSAFSLPSEPIAPVAKVVAPIPRPAPKSAAPSPTKTSTSPLVTLSKSNSTLRTAKASTSAQPVTRPPTPVKSAPKSVAAPSSPKAATPSTTTAQKKTTAKVTSTRIMRV